MKDASNTLLYMDINYIVLLDCSVGEVIKIRLSTEEKIESEKYEDFSEFLETWKISTDSILIVALG